MSPKCAESPKDGPWNLYFNKCLRWSLCLSKFGNNYSKNRDRKLLGWIILIAKRLSSGLLFGLHRPVSTTPDGLDPLKTWYWWLGLFVDNPNDPILPASPAYGDHNSPSNNIWQWLAQRHKHSHKTSASFKMFPVVSQSSPAGICPFIVFLLRIIMEVVNPQAIQEGHHMAASSWYPPVFSSSLSPNSFPKCPVPAFQLQDGK